MKDNRDFLYVIWKDPNSRRNYTIGKLSREKKYTFEYCNEYEEAKAAGWKLLKAFPEIKVYESDTLFPAFMSRLPDPKRRGIEDILKKYGLSQYDGYELLRKSSGRLPIDTYEFIDPIFPDDVTIEKEFYLMGLRHYMTCNGQNCSLKPDLKIGDNLILSQENNNQHDKYAVSVLAGNGIKLGYIPRYYSESVYMRMEKGMSYLCEIIELNAESVCENCIRVKLTMPKEQH